MITVKKYSQPSVISKLVNWMSAAIKNMNATRIISAMLSRLVSGLFIRFYPMRFEGA